ncbi:MAG TPA: Re/Si-specific NAD(P)(+) transhydrogenase subunit alpha [Vicinamibacterales bacterium]|nr:Re/Si-specific NAD(P)(+) transhydrogenase subunit alpha [Vicinamibacterales bacterium]
MRIGVPTEQLPGERRVALVPASIAPLRKAGFDVLVERGAGERAGFPDAVYVEKGGQIVERCDVFGADTILQVRVGDLPSTRQGQVVIGMADPLGSPEIARALAERGVTAFALELIPRITRAQSMDVLSSMATIAGYKAVLLAADALPRMFPLLTTAAGTITPAHVFIVGVGVAGLQAIATARKLGAVVEAYDVRPAVKEQVQSVGAKFVELPLETGQAEDKGGYAKAQDESFYQRQREMMARVVAANDVVITTAVVPGKKAPILVTADMVRGMAPGSVVVDLAAERGGNCELTRADQVVVEKGVTILGPTNLPSTVPYHASQMYAKNITTFLLHLAKDGAVKVDASDEITRDTLIAQGGEVVNARVRAALGLPEPTLHGTP